MSANEILPGQTIEDTHEMSADGTSWVMKPHIAEQYRKSVAEQAASWLAGTPKHNDYAGECCPDFSCCNPKMLWPVEQREAYMKATDEERVTLCIQALAELTATSEVPVATDVPKGVTLH